MVEKVGCKHGDIQCFQMRSQVFDYRLFYNCGVWLMFVLHTNTRWSGQMWQFYWSIRDTFDALQQRNYTVDNKQNTRTERKKINAAKVQIQGTATFMCFSIWCNFKLLLHCISEAGIALFLHWKPPNVFILNKCSFMCWENYLPSSAE